MEEPGVYADDGGYGEEEVGRETEQSSLCPHPAPGLGGLTPSGSSAQTGRLKLVTPAT